MVTAVEQGRPTLVEQQRESPWLSIREGQRAFTKLSRLAPTLPPDFPLNGRIQELIDRESKTAMIRYASPFERDDVGLRENDAAESLFEAIQRGQKAFVAMMEQWLPLTRKITHKIFNRLDMHNTILEFDDLIAAGVEGLMEAVAQYDPARGIQFATRAHRNIYGRIIDEVRQNAGAPRRSLSFLSQIEKAWDLFEATNERTPTLEELGTATGLTEGQVNIGLFYREISVMSFNKPFITADGEEGFIEDFLRQEDQEGVPELAVKRWEYSLLATAISQLEPPEQQVVILYYFKGLTFEEIGSKLGVSCVWASKLHEIAIQRMRAVLLPLGIRPYDPTVGFVEVRGKNNGRLRRRQPPYEEDKERLKTGRG